jgi:hypothetical protein
MNIRKKAQLLAKIGGGCVAFLVCLTGVESANALDFTFSFTNINGNVPGTVEGIIGGLTDNSTSAATSLELTSFPAGLGTANDGTNVLGWGSTFINQFTVTNGSITAADFVAVGLSSGLCIDNNVLCFSGFNAAPSSATNILTFNAASNVVSNSNGFSGVTFNASSTAVPFEFSPTLGLLLVGSLFGSNHFYRKYKANKVVLLTE